MKLKIKEVISAIGKTAKETTGTVTKFADEHKPEIATGVGLALIFGGVATVVVATVKTVTAIADAKEDKLLEIAADAEEYENLSEEEQQEYDAIIDNPLPVMETAKICWKWWILPTTLIAAGTGSILYSNYEQGRRISTLMAKVGALAFQAAEGKDYKEAAKEILGEKKEREIDEAATKKSAERRSTYDYKNDGLPRYGTAVQRYMEYYSGKEFWADPLYIKEAINDLNNRILDARDGCEEYVKLCEWSDILGIDRTGCGEVLAFDVAKGNVKLYMVNAVCGIGDDGLSTIVLRFDKPPEYYVGY